jgi:hypothetical protein
MRPRRPDRLCHDIVFVLGGRARRPQKIKAGAEAAEAKREAEEIAERNPVACLCQGDKKRGVPRPRRSLRDPALAPTQRLSGSCRE